MDPSLRTKRQFFQDDQTWIAGGDSVGPRRSIVLDRSAFDLDSDFPDGFIPSGLALGKVTATGLYAPYNPAGADGTETGVGRLFAGVPYDRDSSADLAAALVNRVEVIEANLPDGDTTDADFKTDVPTITYR